MFSKKLSSSVLSICDSGDLSYEAAAELCDLSSRYFGDIARGKTSPTVNTLEKLCNGLNRTPNELLGFSAAGEELSFRFPRQVIHYRQHPSYNPSFATFPVCPRCHCNLEREYQSFCDRYTYIYCWDCFHYATLMPET